MARVTTRDEFKKYCLRRLGAPVIEINVDDDQVDDRVNDAIEYYQDYHYDGTETTYFKKQLTQEDIDNEYLTIPEEISGVIDIFPIGNGLNTNNLFNLRYQISLNEVFNWSAGSASQYVSAMERISLLNEVFTGKQSLRFNQHTDKLYIDTDWSEKLNVGEFIVVKCYRRISPETSPDAWNDRWLKQYATALIKRQWGENMKKFEGMQLPGGVSFNGQNIYSEAVEEIQRIEEEMITNYGAVLEDMTG